MVDRFQECFQDLVSVFTELPEGQPTPQQLHDWCCDTKAALLEYLETHPGYDCQLRRSVSQIICPSVNQEPSSFLVAFELTRQQLTAIAGELMFACLCRALMPPCPGPVTDDCVPLAVVTVNRSEGCRVESICNWTTLRKYATTFPNLQYWLSILPFGRTLRESLERFCCSGGGLRDLRQPGTAAEVDPTTGQPGTPVPVNNVVGETAYTANTAANGNPVGGAASGTASMNTTVTGATVGAATSGASATGASATGASTAARSAAGASAAASAKRAVLADISPSDAFRPSTKTLNQNIAVSGLAKEAIFSRRQSVDAQTLLFGMMGQKNDKGQDYLSTTQRENLAQFFILDQMAKPMLRSILPSQGEPLDLSELMRTFSAMSVGATPAKPETSTDVSPNTSSGATTLNTNVDLANTSPARASMAAAGTSAAGTSTASTATARTSAASQPAASDPVATAELRIQVKELSETVKRQQAVIDQLTQLVPGVKAATVESATAKSATAKSATAKSATAKSATAKSATAESAVTKSATAKSTTTKSSGTNRAAAKSTDKTSDNSAAKPKGNVKRRPGPSNS